MANPDIADMDVDDDDLLADQLLNQLDSGDAPSALPSAAQEQLESLATLSKLEEEVMDPTNEFLKQRFEARKPEYEVKHILTHENCVHEVVAPIDADTSLAETMERAFEFDFKLDVFQHRATLCIDNNQSVLVAAHTSAGKTAVALYAIATALRNKQRVIYTSPIKALSNQKYRDLCERFDDVGLMTGDVTINPEASVIVMTTEILRSMLYRGSSLMHEIGWVVFDEIHYMRDKERGVVWEETIIMLAHSVHYVFLSATIPNAIQFASWICYLHRQPCHVVYTDYRPTPLQHFIYPVGGDGLYEVLTSNGKFLQDNFVNAMGKIASGDGQDSGSRMQPNKRKSDSGTQNALTVIIRTIKEKDMLPCIVFSFARRDCINYAMALKGIDFTSAQEKEMIEFIFTHALDRLSAEDRKLESVNYLLPYLLRGIGVHHSGLLPIIKEVVEILFGEGYIKILFATETFSMGLNMPARTVIFTTTRKFDGKDNRDITSGEYIQMSGRAGRRGLDPHGNVILMVDQALTNEAAKKIVMGKADPLNSEFRLTYNMILNLLRVEGIEPDFILKKSFYHFQNQAQLPEMFRLMQEKAKEIKVFEVPKEQDVQAFCELKKAIEEKKAYCHDKIVKSGHCAPFLLNGRIVRVVWNNLDFGYGVVIKYERKLNLDATESNTFTYKVQVIIRVSAESTSEELAKLKPAESNKAVRGVLVIVGIESIAYVFSMRMRTEAVQRATESVSYLSLLSSIDKLAASNSLKKMRVQDMKMDQKVPGFEKEYEVLQTLKRGYAMHPIRQDPDFQRIMDLYQRKLELIREKDELHKQFRKSQSESLLAELEARKRVLRRLEYCSEDDIITQKGRVACEISAADELLLTELVFGNVFRDLDAPTAGALMSCFICEEKGAKPKLEAQLSNCLQTMQAFARRIATATKDARIEIDEDFYVDSFKPTMMDAVYEWLSQKTFQEIQSNNKDIFEGSIIRCLRRLEELLRQMVSAAQSIGNAQMEEVFEEARKLLKRDIVFAASLYL